MGADIGDIEEITLIGETHFLVEREGLFSGVTPQELTVFHLQVGDGGVQQLSCYSLLLHFRKGAHLSESVGVFA